MQKNILTEIQNFFDLYKTLSSPLSSSERYNTMKRLEKLFSRINKSDEEDEEILVTQKKYVIGSIMTDEILPITLKNEKYKSEQKKLRIKGRSERNRRTHQLIFIGSIWDFFLENNNLLKYNDTKFFSNTLAKIQNVNVVEKLNLEFANLDVPTSPYNGRDKKIIHRYCQIGGAWESYWRQICKNDVRDKTTYMIKQNYNADQILDIIKANKNIINYPVCNESKCKKIGNIKSRCLKLDEKFFYYFLQSHNSDIIDALIHQ